ncbi:hypothetical protein BHE74_00056676 [Ensete ventricosum]|nr:hypothetical protein BHE74_00056676 [Ensete ventricosum]
MPTPAPKKPIALHLKHQEKRGNRAPRRGGVERGSRYTRKSTRSIILQAVSTITTRKGRKQLTVIDRLGAKEEEATEEHKRVEIGREGRGEAAVGKHRGGGRRSEAYVAPRVGARKTAFTSGAHNLVEKFVATVGWVVSEWVKIDTVKLWLVANLDVDPTRSICGYGSFGIIVTAGEHICHAVLARGGGA